MIRLHGALVRNVSVRLVEEYVVTLLLGASLARFFHFDARPLTLLVSDVLLGLVVVDDYLTRLFLKVKLRLRLPRVHVKTAVRILLNHISTTTSNRRQLAAGHGGGEGVALGGWVHVLFIDLLVVSLNVLHILHKSLSRTLIIGHLHRPSPFILSTTACAIILPAARIETLSNASQPPAAGVVGWGRDSAAGGAGGLGVHGQIQLVNNSSVIDKIILNRIKSHLILIRGWEFTCDFINRARWLRILLIRRVINCLLLITVLLILLLLGASFTWRQEEALAILYPNPCIIRSRILASLLISKLLLLLVGGMLQLAALGAF